MPLTTATEDVANNSDIGDAYTLARPETASSMIFTPFCWDFTPSGNYLDCTYGGVRALTSPFLMDLLGGLVGIGSQHFETDLVYLLNIPAIPTTLDHRSFALSFSYTHTSNLVRWPGLVIDLRIEASGERKSESGDPFLWVQSVI